MLGPVSSSTSRESLVIFPITVLDCFATSFCYSGVRVFRYEYSNGCLLGLFFNNSSSLYITNWLLWLFESMHFSSLTTLVASIT
jgi:hypothetical protein